MFVYVIFIVFFCAGFIIGHFAGKLAQ